MLANYSFLSIRKANILNKKVNKCPAQIRIGTRNSLLAIAQASEVKNRLLGAYPELTQNQIEIIKIVTTGDKLFNKNLATIGGKGLFTKELEDALSENKIDIAVHSMKDMPYKLPEKMKIACILEREDARDAFISLNTNSIKELPKGAVIGTSSLRRKAQMLRIRNDIKIVPFRGNIHTRIKKLQEKQVDATILAFAGLKRSDMTSHIKYIFSEEEILPAIGQGAIGIECLEKYQHIIAMLEKFNHHESFLEIKAERAFLRKMQGSCVTPLAGIGKIIDDDKFSFKAILFSEDGTESYEVKKQGNLSDAKDMCESSAQQIIKNAGHLLI